MANSYRSDLYNLPRFGGRAFTPALDVNYQTQPEPERCAIGFTVMTISEGDVVVTTLAGLQRTYPAVPAYFVIPVQVRSVDTGTNATVEGLA